MSDSRAYDAEQERLIAECEHNKGYDMVCRGCGLPKPAPADGWQAELGEWYDTALD